MLENNKPGNILEVSYTSSYRMDLSFLSSNFVQGDLMKYVSVAAFQHFSKLLENISKTKNYKQWRISQST